MNDLTPLPRLVPALIEANTYNPGYRKLYALAVDGSFPATFLHGRWYYRASDLPKIIRIVNGQSVELEAA